MQCLQYLVWGIINHHTLSSLRFDKARAKTGQGTQLGGIRTVIAGALPLIPVTGTEKSQGSHLPSKMRGCSKDSNPESCCLSIHPVPCHPNPLCAFTSEDNIMRHPNLSFVEKSLKLGKEVPFCPVPQCQPSMETLTGTSVCYSVKSSWAGQVSSFLSLSVKKISSKAHGSFFPSWMPSLVSSPDPKKSHCFLALWSWFSWLPRRRKGHQAAGHCCVWRAWMMKSLLPEKQIY